MLPSIFFKQLFLISAATALCLFGINQFAAISPYKYFSWICLAFFILLTIVMYLVGNLTSKSKNKTAFTGTILGFTFGKMLLCVGIVIAYHQYIQPSSKAFVIPFFLVYLVYTAFETHFMQLLGKQKR